jgi:ribonucleoside-diphosphate reductase alpha chain
MNKARDLANLFKRRCGVGVDVSKLRHDGARVNNSAGTSTGAWSFADLYSYVTRMVGQNNRRGALMVTMDVRHPDVEKFITMKHDLTKVTGANVSVKLTDDFMRAVKDDAEYTQRWPVEGKAKFKRSVKARQVWDLIISSATHYAEPGLLMWDNIIKYLPAHCYPDFVTICVNPCAELALSANDSCRLISQNLKWYVESPFTDKAWFNFDKFLEHTAYAMRLSDDLVELELEKLQGLHDIAGSEDERVLYKKLWTSCMQGRRTGLGTHGLADALARMQLKYDSDEAIDFIETIYARRKNAAYKESVALAVERGSFPVFDWELEKDNAFIKELGADVQELIAANGRRNISLLTNAPTGTVSILSQTSSGLEPVFKTSYVRRKKKNHDEAPEHDDYVDDLGDRWKEFRVVHPNLLECFDALADQKKKVERPDYFVEADKIDWEKRIEVQAAIQRHVDHSISSTINLPKGTKPEVVGNLYMKAWESGLKGVTVYVDGSRSGVLVTEKSEKNEFVHVNAPKRPIEMECDIHHVSVKGEKWVFFVGLMEGKPYEVFGGLSENIEMPPEYKKGKIIKTSSFKHVPNRYDLKVNGFTIKNFLKQFDNPTNQVLTRMVSLSLRHGARPSFLVEQLLKDPDNDLTSFSKVLSRVLKKYIIDGETVTSDKTCSECGAEGLTYQEGCATCTSCGYAKCG